MYFTGFYNIIFEDIIIQTDFFIYKEEKNEDYVIKKILKKYKKTFEEHYIDNVKIDIINIDFYEKTYNFNDIEKSLEYQLDNVLLKKNIKVNKTFDFSNLLNILNSI